MEDNHTREQPLQAVVLADSFAEQFRPVTLERPKVLLPLAGKPMLDFSLELLARNQVKEVFIFCTAHAKRVEEFVEAAGWNKRFDSVVCICSSACASVGEALRWLDDNHKGAVASDPFVLIHGDTVSNLELGPHIAAHKQRRKQRAENTMTMFLQRSGRASTRPVEDDLVVGVDDKTKQVVLFSDDPKASLINVPRRVLETHDALTFHTDVVDSQVYLCSPEVLWRFNESFDYADLRKDFIAMEVADLELGQVVFAEQLHAAEYCARAHDPRVYHGICQDILHRWTFPIVPETSFGGGGGAGSGASGPGEVGRAQLVPHKTRYRRSQAAISNCNAHGQASIVYRDTILNSKRPMVARTASLSGAVMLGAGVVVGEQCTIESSTLGPGTQLGERVQLRNCHLWQGVTVEDGADVQASIICDGVTIKAGARIDRGCVLSFGVVVGAGVHVPAFTRLTLSEATEDDGFGSEEDEELVEEGVMVAEEEQALASAEQWGQWDKHLVGPDGKGRAWVPDADEFEGGEEKEAAGAAGPGEDPWRGGSLGAVEHERLAKQRHLQGVLLAEEEEEEDEEEELEAGGVEYLEFDEGEALAGHGRAGVGGGSSAADPWLGGAAAPSAAGSLNAQANGAAAGGQGSFTDAIADLVQHSNAGDPASVQALITEVKCYKLAQNRSFDDCLAGVVAALFRMSACDATAQGSKATLQLTNGLKANLVKVKELVMMLLPSAKDEEALIGHLEATGATLPHFELGLVLKLLYDEPLEILTEDAILAWAVTKREAITCAGPGQDEHRLFEQTKTQQFLEWLEEEEEEEDESESEEEQEQEQEQEQ